MNSSTLVSRLMVTVVSCLILGAAVDAPQLGRDTNTSTREAVQPRPTQTGPTVASMPREMRISGNSLRLSRGEAFIACQPPDQLSHGGFPLVHSDEAFGSLAAESFTANDLQIVDRIRWWGAYLTEGSITPCASILADDFTVTIYADSGGLPGAVVSSNSLAATAVREATGLTVSYFGSDHDEYRYTADLVNPFAVSAGETYWVEIVRGNVDTCTWWWETAPVGTDGDGTALWDETGAGYAVQGFDLSLCIFEPPPPFVDCNGNGIDDPCDLDCGTVGGNCDVPNCGLSVDIDGNGVPDDCEDCNSNGVVDGCDLDCGAVGGPCDVPNCGSSMDTNSNGIPDDCEDCNENGVLDSIDIASCPAGDFRCFDCDNDGRPDECVVAHVTCFDTDCNNEADLCESAGNFDCNANSVHDLMDIANGTSSDLNTNCRPDECDVPPSAQYPAGLCDAAWLPQSSCCSEHPEPGCDDPTCEAIVCASDSFCCSDSWDSLCVSAVLGGDCGPDICASDPSCLRDSNENGIPDEAENECLTVSGDAEFDCDADVRDFMLFQACFTGSVGPVYPAAYEIFENNEVICDCLDVDFDGDVDFDDFDQFRTAFESTDPLCEVCPDIWSTTVGATTQFEFKDDGVVNTAIPAGFFGNNSAQFVGVVELTGVRTPTLDLSEESTSRFDTRVLHPLPSFASVELCPNHSTVPLMVLGLRLVSKQPVFVPSTGATTDCNLNGCPDADEIDAGTCSGSACGCSPDSNGDDVPDECQTWLMSVNLSHTRPAAGRLHAWTTHSAGGFFSAQLNIQPVFQFTLLQDLLDQKPFEDVRTVTFDTGVLGITPMQLSFDSLPWAQTVGDEPTNDIFVLSCADGNFVPGYDTDPGGCGIPCIGRWSEVLRGNDNSKSRGGGDPPEPNCTSHITPEEAHFFCPPECESVLACHYVATEPASPTNPDFCPDCSGAADELPDEMWTSECEPPCAPFQFLFAECGLDGNGNPVNCGRPYGIADPECSFSDDLDGDGIIDSCDNDADGDTFEGPLGDEMDCNDLDPTVNPAAPEVCDDGIDNDCDELIDDADSDCP